MDIAVPDEFKDFCRHFHQDVMLIHSTPDEMIASALRSLNEQQKHVIRRFLDELLSGRYSSAEIKGIWRKTPADIYFPKAQGLLEFLRLMRDAVG
jgi:hypothetical protein